MGVLDLRRPVTLQIVAFLEQLTGWAKHRARIKLKVVLLQKLESCPLHSKKHYIYIYIFVFCDFTTIQYNSQFGAQN